MGISALLHAMLILSFLEIAYDGPRIPLLKRRHLGVCLLSVCVTARLGPFPSLHAFTRFHQFYAHLPELELLYLATRRLGICIHPKDVFRHCPELAQHKNQ